MYKTENELVQDLKKAFEKNEDLPEKLLESKDAGELKEVLARADLKLEEEEAELMFKEVKNQLSDELDEEALDDVSGGSIVAGVTIIGAGVAFAIGVAKSMRCRRK